VRSISVYIAEKCNLLVMFLPSFSSYARPLLTAAMIFRRDRILRPGPEALPE
jgi:hypothetical protein